MFSLKGDKDWDGPPERATYSQLFLQWHCMFAQVSDTVSFSYLISSYYAYIIFHVSFLIWEVTVFYFQKFHNCTWSDLWFVFSIQFSWSQEKATSLKKRRNPERYLSVIINPLFCISCSTSIIHCFWALEKGLYKFYLSLSSSSSSSLLLLLLLITTSASSETGVSLGALVVDAIKDDQYG